MAARVAGIFEPCEQQQQHCWCLSAKFNCTFQNPIVLFSTSALKGMLHGTCTSVPAFDLLARRRRRRPREQSTAAMQQVPTGLPAAEVSHWWLHDR